jgi:CDP-diacylglycerol--serine O-phosphatidyltransferase
LELDAQGWRRLVPSLATGLTLLLGLGAIEAARFGDPELGLRFILLAILADGIDGVLARRWGAVTDFGGHLDSLADVVTFGVAPGILFAAQHPEAPGPVRVIVMAMIAIAGAWRLARFGSEPSRADFVGLPITTGGPLFALAVAGAQPASADAGVVWALTLAALMVSRVPFPRFTRGRLGQAMMLLAAVFVVALAFDGKFALAAAQVGLMGYVAWSLVRSIGMVAVNGRAATGGRGRSH